MTLAETRIRPAPDFRRLRMVLLREGYPDRVPFYELFANREIMERALGKPVPDRAATVEFYYRTGYDYVPVWPGFTMPAGRMDGGDNPIGDRAGFERYTWPAPGAFDLSEFTQVAAILPPGMSLIAQTGGIFERAESLCGYPALCYLLADDRRLVGDIFSRIGEFYTPMYRAMARHERVGAVVISDDLGFRSQTLISPADIREFVFPWYRQLVAAIHDAGKPCILHSCGQLDAIMDELIADIGIDAKHSYEDAILPVEEAKRRYGDRIAILGGFDVDRLCRSTPEAIRRHTRHLVTDLGRQGGYALGSGNSIAAFVPVDHYLTMLDEGWGNRYSSTSTPRSLAAAS